MTPRERFIAALLGRKLDRPPFILPGGLVGSLPAGVCRAPGHALHSDARLLADLSLSMAKSFGVESLGLPFSMTLETEAYGGEVEEGFPGALSRARCHVIDSARDYGSLPRLDPLGSARLPVAIDAIRILRRERPDMPVIADLVGPMSLASSLLNPAEFPKAFVKTPDDAGKLLDFLADNSIRFLKELAGAGADAVFIMDPASTGIVLGADCLGRFSRPYLNKLAGAAHGLGLLAIAHLCGTMEDVAGPLSGLKADAISIDARVDAAELKRVFQHKAVVGNVDAGALESLLPEEVLELSQKALGLGVAALSPSCGLTRGVRAENLLAMKRACDTHTAMTM